MTIAVRVLRDGGQLADLRPAWRALWNASPDATPFQHPDWVLPWWRHLGNGAPRVLVAERRGRLLGLMPLCAVAGEGRIVLRPFGFDVSDYAEPLIGPDEPGETLAALFDSLAGAPGWDACAFVLREGSRVDGGPGLRARRRRLDPAPVLDLSGGVPDCLARGIRKSVKEAQRRLRKTGEATFETATPASADAILGSLFALHRRRWRERGSAGVLDHPAVRSFHVAAAPRLAASGLLRLYRMRIDGRDAAVLHALAGKGTVHYYIGGFAPEHAAVSPGTLVIAHAVERAAAEGARCFDFLMGQEGYKYRWGAVDRGRWGLEITRAEETADDAAPRERMADAAGA